MLVSVDVNAPRTHSQRGTDTSANMLAAAGASLASQWYELHAKKAGEWDAAELSSCIRTDMLQKESHPVQPIASPTAATHSCTGREATTACRASSELWPPQQHSQ